ncbi:tetratricopeptide repeat protein [Microvirga sp. SRT04]|uniref:Tetratricopeptide repeat protein n=1 Tax=Hymenobacter properus TaxID=2791026 RepID=A0A931BJC0_9BACT|nr:tetratricopeptide repeat protein [Hymenobacter properus]MBR7722384.1 tetratricopeptide repeat protein [Microvirga sp. SRT04]
MAQQPTHAVMLGWLGVCLLNQHRPAEAIPILQRAIGHAPLNPQLHGWLAESYSAAKDFFAAEAASREALRLAPEQADFHGLAGMVLLRKHRPKQALRAARTGLCLDPAHKQCLTVQARALADLGQTNVSAPLFAPVLVDDPLDAFAHANQGFNYLDAGNFRAAQLHLHTALQQQPDNAQIRAGLVEALKNSFWYYRLLWQGGRWVTRLVRRTGFFALEADTRKIIAYVLQIPLLFFVWGWAFAHGFFSNIGYLSIGFRLLLLTPLGVIIILTLAGALLQSITLTLLRCNPQARPYLSSKEILASNCFLAGLGVLAVSASARFAGLLF